MTWLFKLLDQMSPTLVDAFRDGMKQLLDNLAEKAAETENKWDDWGVEMIRKVFISED